MAKGEATWVSLSPVSGAAGGWALVVAPGQIVDARHAAMEGPHGMFRFETGPVAHSFGRWCAAGASHRAALLGGNRLRALEAAASALGIEVRRV